MADIIQLPIDTSANWLLYNPVLAKGMPGYESDTNRCKLGDGLSSWVELEHVADITGLVESTDFINAVGIDPGPWKIALDLQGTNTGDQDLSGLATTSAVAAGYVALTGNQTIAGNKTLSGITVITDATNSGSTTSGAFQVTGGAGFGGTVYGGASFWCGATAGLGITGRSRMMSSSDGNIQFRNNANSADSNIACAGVTASGAVSGASLQLSGDPILQKQSASTCVLDVNGTRCVSYYNSDTRVFGNVDIGNARRLGFSTGDPTGIAPTVTVSRQSDGVLQIGTTGNSALGSLALTNLTALGNVSSALAFVSQESLGNANTAQVRLVANLADGLHGIDARPAGAGSARGFQILTSGSTLRVGGTGTSGNTDNSGIRLGASDGSAADYTSVRMISGTLTASSGTQQSFVLNGQVQQTGTAGYRGMLISPRIITTGSGSGRLLDVGLNSSSTGLLGTHTSFLSIDISGNTAASGKITSTSALGFESGVDGTVSGLYRVASDTTGAVGNFQGRPGGGVRIDTSGNGSPVRIDGSRLLLGPSEDISLSRQSASVLQIGSSNASNALGVLACVRVDTSTLSVGGVTVATIVNSLSIPRMRATIAASYHATAGNSIWCTNAAENTTRVGINRGDDGTIIVQQAGSFGWGSTGDVRLESVVLGFDRASADVVEINNGTVGALRDLSLRNLTASGTLKSGPFTVASLPVAASSAYATTWVTNSSVDRTSVTIGNVVAGGGAFIVPVTCNGTDWRIL